MMKLKLHICLLAVVILSMTAVSAFCQATPQATSAYVLRVFATAPTGHSSPDSIAVLNGHVFVGYGDGVAKDGSDGKSSHVVEFRMDGAVVHIYSVPGHNDGLKVDPQTGLLWALQNEDGNPNLVIIDPQTQQQTSYSFGPTAQGGGYDDIVFRNGKIYISASNPSRSPNTDPAIVSALIVGNMVDVTPVLSGVAPATNILTDMAVTLNLQDPDSMTLDPLGNILLDSQADDELIFVTNPGSTKQRALVLPLSYMTSSGPTPGEVDDTAFVTSNDGFILFADKNLNTVYKLEKKDSFFPGAAYASADLGPFVGKLDLSTGVITPVVTGLSNPGGLVFVDTSDQNQQN